MTPPRLTHGLWKTTMTEWHSNKYWQNRSKEERLKNLRIPPRFADKTLSNYDTGAGDAEAFSAIMRWCDKAEQHINEGMGLLLYGPTGVGKTHLAQGAMSLVVAKNLRSGIFTTADRYIEMSHDERNNDGELPEQYSDPYLLKYMNRTFDIVVLDGLGSERATTEYAHKALSGLIGNRYENKLTTIVTTLLSPVDVGRLYGKRILSMLQESCFFINVDGSDYRTIFNDAR